MSFHHDPVTDQPPVSPDTTARMVQHWERVNDDLMTADQIAERKAGRTRATRAAALLTILFCAFALSGLVLGLI